MSGEKPLNDLGFLHAGQLLVESTVGERQLMEVEPHQVQDRRM